MRIITTVSCVGAALMLAAFAAPQAKAPANFSFFITSAGSGDGANLGGIAGADKICQTRAAAAGAGNKTWRAYLSTGGAGAVNARDRIGQGPWYNVKGVQVASSVADLHSANNKLSKENSIT